MVLQFLVGDHWLKAKNPCYHFIGNLHRLWHSIICCITFVFYFQIQVRQEQVVFPEVKILKLWLLFMYTRREIKKKISPEILFLLRLIAPICLFVCLWLMEIFYTKNWRKFYTLHWPSCPKPDMQRAPQFYTQHVFAHIAMVVVDRIWSVTMSGIMSIFFLLEEAYQSVKHGLPLVVGPSKLLWKSALKIDVIPNTDQILLMTTILMSFQKHCCQSISD